MLISMAKENIPPNYQETNVLGIVFKNILLKLLLSLNKLTNTVKIFFTVFPEMHSWTYNIT